MTDSTICVLAGDIGGTSTRLAVFNVCGQRLDMLAKASYPSQQYTSLDEML